MRGEWQDNILYCPVSRSLVVLFATLLDSSSVCWEMKRQLIAFSNQTPIFLCDNVLLSLRPAQNEVHPGHGRAHAGGHAGAGAGAEESHHPHLLRYDAVWAQLQPRTHVWNGKKKKKKWFQNFAALWCVLFWVNRGSSRLNMTFETRMMVWLLIPFLSLCSLRTNW